MESFQVKEMINIGYGNFIRGERVLAVMNPDSAPVKRLIQELKNEHLLLDATFGRKTRSVLVLDSGHLLIASNSTEVVSQKLNQLEQGGA